MYFFIECWHLLVCGGGGRLVAFFSNPVIGCVHWGLNILCIMFKIIGFLGYCFFFYNIAVLQEYVRVGILLTSWKYLYDRIISLSWTGWAYKSILALTLFIKAPVLSKESERSYICVIDFRVVPTVWYFLFFIFFPFIH